MEWAKDEHRWKGSKRDEKFVNFLGQYFESKGCSVKVKMVKD
jgi:hypothetical protein